MVAGIVGGAFGLPASQSGASDNVFTISLIAFPALGWLLVVRGPRNALGWLYLIFPLVLFVGYAAELLAFRAAETGTTASAAVLLLAAAWLISIGYWLLFGPALLLFPDGRMPGPLFRWTLGGSAAILVVLAAASVIGIEQVCVDLFGEAGVICTQWVENPLALTQVPGLGQAPDMLLIIIILSTLGISLFAVILRYRRSAGEIRQQIKWVAWVASLAILIFLGLSVLQLGLGLSVNEWVDVISFLPLSLGLPAAIGVAIFKYRLYDIDRIISRTAAYSLVAAVLLAVFGASVALTQQLLPFDSQFGAVVSTLLVAALFNPLRSRVQRAVDRSFNRSRYDAQQVLEAFSTHVRHQVELEPMQSALLRTAEETLEPAHLSLWVREREAEEITESLLE